MRDYSDIVNRTKKKKEESLNSSSFGSHYDATSTVEKTRLGKKINFDTFETDLQNLGDTLGNIYSEWQDADTMTNTRTSVEEMQKRLNYYQEYQQKYGGNDLSEVAKGYQSVLEDWDNLTNLYGQYKDADSYTAERDKLNELYSMSADDLASYIEDEDNPIAYTTVGGQDITWQSLYDNQNHKAMAVSEEGTQGWEKYLADEEAAMEEQIETAENEKWYDKVARYLGGTSDTTLPAAEINQVVKYKMYDDSYKKPTDDWTQEEKNIFGAYYLSEPEKAYEYATNLNNEKAKAEKEGQKQDVVNSATSGFWAGAGHTAGSLVTAPLGLADYLDDLTDSVAGRPIVEESFITPFEYSQAVTGGISSHLNDKYGTLNENVPIIGGKGVGDVYGLGTSIAQSAVSAYTLGELGTLVSYFGQGAASGVDDALARGANDEQALLYGTILGAAEGVAEQIGVDKLLSIGASSTLKELFVNVLKQGVSEGTEELLTSVAGNVADNLILQDKSNFNASVRKYMANGLSETEAKQKAWFDAVGDIAYDALAGFVSGSVHAAPHTAVQTYKANAKQKMDAALNTPDTSEVGVFQPEAENAVQQPDDSNMSKGAENINAGERTNNHVKLEGIRIMDGATVLVTNQGERSVDEITLSAKEAELVSYAENMSEEKANLLIAQYDGKSDVENFVTSFEMAYTYGEVGFQSDSVLKNKGVLTEAQAAEIYKTAVINTARARQNAIDEINTKHGKTMTISGTFDDSIIDYKNATTDNSKVNWRRLTPSQRDALTFAKGFSKATGVNIKLIKSEVVNGKHVGKNGSYNPATNTIEIDIYAGIEALSKKAEDAIIPTLSHELTHWMKEKSPAMYSQMREHIMETLISNSRLTSAALIKAEKERIKKNHPDVEATDDMAIDELMARSCEDMLSNSEKAAELLEGLGESEKKSFVEKVKETISNLRKWVQDLLGKYKSNSAEAKFLRQYDDRLKELSKMWDHALEEAIQTNQNLQKEGITGEPIQLSDRNTENSSVKEQLMQAAKTLNAMEPVAQVSESKTFNSKQEVKEWALEKFTKDSFKISRAGFGEIILDKKRISNGLRYIKTREEILAFSAVPQVLRKGIVIGEHPKHKGRDYDTITFAAPVIINSTRGNLAVVIRREDNNYYKVHRLVMPDGKQFFLNNEKDTAERAGGVENNSGLSPTDNVFNNIIPDSAENTTVSEEKFSDRDQAEYAKAEDDGLYEYANDVINGAKKWEPYVLSKKISKRFASDIKRIVGFSVEGYGNAIHQSEIEHINARHGKNGTADHSMADLHELAKVQYVIDNYTNIREGNRSSHFRNADGSYARTVLLQAKVNDGFYYVVEAVPDSKRKKLMITSAFKNKKDIFSEGVNTNDGPNLYVQDDAQPNISSKNIIPDSTENTTVSEEKFSDRENASIYDLMDENENLEKQNAKLEEDITRLKERLKLEKQITKGNTFNEKQLRAVVNYLLKISESNYDAKLLESKVKEVYDYIVQTPNLEWDDLFAMCYDVARDVLAEQKPTKVTNDYYKSVLTDIRKTRISLSEEQIQEAKNAYGDKYRNAFMGRVILAKDGISLDTKWQEWSAMYPEIFGADITGGDQIIALSDIYDSLREASETYQIYNDTESIRAFAVEIYNQYWNVSTIHTTADKYDKQIKRLNFEHRKAISEMRSDYKQKLEKQKIADAMHYGKLVKKIRQQRDAEVKRAKELGRQHMSEYKDRVARRAKIESITRNALRLNKQIKTNPKDKPVPEVMKKPVVHLLNAIDFSSKQLLGIGRITDASYTPTKRDQNLASALSEVYMMAHEMEEQNNSSGDNVWDNYIHLPDRYVWEIKQLAGVTNDIVEKTGDTRFVLNQMTNEQLDSLNDILQVLKTTINTANECLSFYKKETIKGLVNAQLEYAEDFEEKQGGNKVTDFLEFDQTQPVFFFDRLGPVGKKLFAIFQDAQDKLALKSKQIKEFTEEAYSSKDANKWGKQILEFDVMDIKRGKTKKIQMTATQAMYLYLLSKRKVGQKHLYTGGIRMAEFEVNGKKRNDSEGANITKEFVDMVVGKLSKEQIEVADKLSEFLNDYCTEWGNETTMRLYGTKMFGKEKNYVPIEVVKSGTKIEARDNPESLYGILNMSFTKKLVPEAGNQVVLRDVFEVFASHTSSMARYNAFAAPVYDFLKWYGYNETVTTDTGAEYTRNTRDAIQRMLGEGGNKYIRNFMKDINGNQQAGRGEELISKQFSNFKLASVAWNMNVALLQPLSYLRAAAILSPKYLAKGIGVRKIIDGVKKAKNNSGIAIWKSMGYYDTDISKGLEEQIRNADTWSDKLKKASMKLPELADQITWGALWEACEYYVADNNKDIEVGSKEFLEEVNLKFRDIVYRTQVVDSVMTRSQLMRSKSGVVKGLTSFMSESTVTYNMVSSIYYEWQMDKRTPAECRKKYGKRLASAIAVYALSAVAEASIRTLTTAMRNAGGEDDEEETLMDEFLAQLIDNLNPLSKIPILQEVVSVSQGYDVTALPGLQAIESTKKAYDEIAGMLMDGEEISYKKVYRILQAVSQWTGHGASNAFRDVVAIWNLTFGAVYPSCKVKQ